MGGVTKCTDRTRRKRVQLSDTMGEYLILSAVPTYKVADIECRVFPSVSFTQKSFRKS